MHYAWLHTIVESGKFIVYMCIHCHESYTTNVVLIRLISIVKGLTRSTILSVAQNAPPLLNRLLLVNKRFAHNKGRGLDELATA